MSRVFQRPDRGGYYLGVPVPSELLKKLKKSEVVRKLGNTIKKQILNVTKQKQKYKESLELS